MDTVEAERDRGWTWEGTAVEEREGRTSNVSDWEVERAAAQMLVDGASRLRAAWERRWCE